MKTLLLLAGRSRRFWPLSEKSLFPICGKALLEHQIERLEAGGCDDITLVGGNHNLEEARALLPSFKFIEQKDLDMGMQGALIDALPSVGNDSVLIVSANDVIDSSAYAELRKAAGKKGVEGVLLAQRVKRYFPGGYLTVDGDRVTGIVEKPGEGKEPSDLVNIVAHVHNGAPALLAALKSAKSEHDDGYERAVESLLRTKQYRSLPYEGAWQAVKYSWHLLPLLELLLADIKERKIHKSVKIHDSAVIEGNVVIEEGSRVLPNACIVGPCYIGKGVTIGNGCLLRSSSIGNGSVIGFNTEVKGSVLAGDVWTHTTYLGDSILGRNVGLGGGTMTGNFRLDEQEITSAWEDKQLPTGLWKLGVIIGDNCRIGIQVGFNPGVKIGGGSFVAGGAFVTNDAPDNSYVREKNGEIHVSPNRSSPPDPAGRDRYRKRIL